MHPMVNRDLSRRIRTVTPITNLKPVVRSDLKLCAKIISQFDKKYKLWLDSDRPIEEKYRLNSRNPVLQNITEYLVEEASAEEEALLGEVSETSEEVEEKDPNVFKILDRMIWYLRLVHSIDYYNHSLYLNEDEMPNRCGIMHARIMSSVYKCSQAEVAEYCKSFESKLSALLNPMPKELSEQELIDLGAKSADAEIEKFMLANTQELGPEKWMCPLSGKKFRGPEFVRKHIENKHAEKLDEVKREVAYYNNYLKDEQRPRVPEIASPRPKGNELSSNPSMVANNPFPYGGYGNAWGGGAPGFGPPMSYGYPRPQQPMRNNYGRGRGSHRPIVNYRDLDAPKEPEEFI